MESENKQNQPETPDELKEKGNQAVRQERYSEAVLHYSFAIKLSPNDPILYSNRSFAFLKLKQLYYANEDAEKAIQLKPDWAKAHFRKAEVHLAAANYDVSLLSYGRALQLQPNESILNAAKHCASLSTKQAYYESRVPWVGAGIGLVLGVIIVVSDQLTKTPALKHPILMLLLIVALAGICYGIARLYRYYTKLQTRGLLDPPIDILESFKKTTSDDVEGNNVDSTPNRNRYSKAQARQRFRKGLAK
ncbi:U-box domain-containing protein 70 [Pseudolycoriella hygida]|uniref:U-box domain-containing protein 70 n=1 Tax=Pseudolycoriella hygida TaxID=35572 RepID=A0A9Q0NAN8_9DIPT|nr:U-box domain-containing protein 70 [Pseudolycoriella hygida]